MLIYVDRFFVHIIKRVFDSTLPAFEKNDITDLSFFFNLNEQVVADAASKIDLLSFLLVLC